MQLIDVARMLGSMFMSVEPLDRRRGRLGVERRQHEVAGHRGAERDLRRLLVTDLADEEDVGVGAQDRSAGRSRTLSPARGLTSI